MFKIFKTLKEKLFSSKNKREQKSSNKIVNKKSTKKEFSNKSIKNKTHRNKFQQNKFQQNKSDIDARTNKKKYRWSVAEFVVEQTEGKVRFHDFKLPNSIMHAIFDLGFKYCTPIQSEILPDTLQGKDAIGKAQTGTGKTAAFLIVIFAKLIRNKIKEKRNFGTPRALILAPTRELAMQIASDAEKLGKYNRFEVMAIYGGMDYKKQKEQLRNKVVDIVVATSGRLIDFMRNKDIDLSKVEVLVIDEADAMLDMGFIPEVKQIVKATPRKESRQTLFFSATINVDVENLSYSWTREPVKIEIEPETIAVKTVKKVTYTIMDDDKYNLLYNIINSENLQRAIVFCNRRDETISVYKKLYGNGIDCAVLSSDIDQRKRIKTLENFKSGNIKVLIATDVAGRGIHIDDVSHVINYTLPDDPEDYVHRIGRTGRAGARGVAINLASEIDSFNIPTIEKFICEKLECSLPSEELLKEAPAPIRKLVRQQRGEKKNYNTNDRKQYNKSRNAYSNKGKYNKRRPNNKVPVDNKKHHVTKQKKEDTAE